MTRFKDYDLAISEVEEGSLREEFEFKIGGSIFVAPTSAEAREMLRFLRQVGSTDSAQVADGIRAIMGEEVWSLIFDPKRKERIEWESVRALVNDLATYYGGGIVGVPKAILEDQEPDPEPDPDLPTEEDLLSNGLESIPST